MRNTEYFPTSFRLVTIFFRLPTLEKFVTLLGFLECLSQRDLASPKKILTIKRRIVRRTSESEEKSPSKFLIRNENRNSNLFVDDTTCDILRRYGTNKSAYFTNCEMISIQIFPYLSGSACHFHINKFKLNVREDKAEENDFRIKNSFNLIKKKMYTKFLHFLNWLSLNDAVFTLSIVRLFYAHCIILKLKFYPLIRMSFVGYHKVPYSVFSYLQYQ